MLAVLDQLDYICEYLLLYTAYIMSIEILGWYNDWVDVQLSLKHRSYALSSSPLCLHLLDCRREEGSWACQLLFLSLYSFLLFPLSIHSSLTLPPFIDDQPVSSSCCGRLWMLCMWLNDTQCFFSLWKHLCLSSEHFSGEAKSLISDIVKPKLRDLSLMILCFTAFSGFFPKLFALRHLVLHSVPYITALMSQWPH